VRNLRIYNHFIKALFVYFFLIFFSQVCLAYSIDDFLLDILMLYQNGLDSTSKEAVVTRISLFSKLLEKDNEKLAELAIKLSNFNKKQKFLIYKILKNYLNENIINYLFPDIKKPIEMDINSKINDKTASMTIIDENYIYNNDENKEKSNEDKKDDDKKLDNNSQNNNQTKENTTQTSNNQDNNNKNNNKNTNNSNNNQNNSQSSNNNNDSQTNSSNQKTEEKNNQTNKQEKTVFNIEGLKVPQIQEIYNKYTIAELDNIYKDAVKLYYNNDLNKAFIEFWICLVNNFNPENSSYYLAFIYEKEQDFDSAIILYKNSINIFLAKQSVDSKFLSYLFKRLGISYNQKKLFEEGILYLKKSIEYYPADGEAYFQIGLAYYNLQNYDKAKEYFQKALQFGYQKAQEYLKKLG
jgi:tetratricopeptide (TPR) repeat protein